MLRRLAFFLGIPALEPESCFLWIHAYILFPVEHMYNGLTRFFRNRDQLKTLEYLVIPEIVKKKEGYDNPVLRIWSAGCSTGEEPYSIAMLCREILPVNFTIRITGTDINSASLATAKKGFYSAEITSDVPARFLERYFDVKPGGFRLRGSIRDTVRYAQQNLTAGSGLSRQDIVLLRNVNIYYDKSTQQEILNEVRKSMDSCSYLFIGEAESIFGLHAGFEFVYTDWSVLYRKC